MGTSVIIGGTEGLGRHIAERHAGRGRRVVVGGRDREKAAVVAAEIGGGSVGIATDLSRPHSLAKALEEVGEVDHLVLTGSYGKFNTLESFDLDAAITAVTVKLVGYAEAVRVLRDRFTPAASVVLFGGLAKERPYPGSTVVSTHNAALTGLVKTLAVEIAPFRVNALHPGLVGDSPRWRDAQVGAVVERTPIGRLVTMDEVADATDFLLGNGGVNGQDLFLDGGVLVR